MQKQFQIEFYKSKPIFKGLSEFLIIIYIKSLPSVMVLKSPSLIPKLSPIFLLFPASPSILATERAFLKFLLLYSTKGNFSSSHSVFFPSRHCLETDLTNLLQLTKKPISVSSQSSLCNECPSF